MIKRSFTTVLPLAAVAALALSGCSSNASADAEESAAQAAQSTVAAANAAQSEGRLTIVKTPESIDGGQVGLPIKRDLILDVDAAEAGAWTVTFSDPSIAEFDASEPSIHPLAEGETTVELAGPDGATSTFTLIVTPGAR